MLLNKRVKLFLKLAYLKIKNRLFRIVKSEFSTTYSSIVGDPEAYSISITSTLSQHDSIELNGWRGMIDMYFEFAQQKHNIRINNMQQMIKYIKKFYF